MVSWFRIALLVLFVIHDTIKRERRATCKLAAMPNGTYHQARPKAVMKKRLPKVPNILRSTPTQRRPSPAPFVTPGSVSTRVITRRTWDDPCAETAQVTDLAGRFCNPREVLPYSSNSSLQFFNHALDVPLQVATNLWFLLSGARVCALLDIYFFQIWVIHQAIA